MQEFNCYLCCLLMELLRNAVRYPKTIPRFDHNYFTDMFARVRYDRSGVAGDAKGRGTRVWSPYRVEDPREWVGTWTVVMEIATLAGPFVPSHTDNNRWSKRQG